jgi:NTP pyrophosphatase (non-canonical NTP hydrolase)
MVSYIRDQIPEEELLVQLAEEASELAQAALKFHRVLDGRNPTPVRLSEAWANLQEEISDVFLCLTVLEINPVDQEYLVSMQKKLDRWVGRLREKEDGAYG